MPGSVALITVSVRGDLEAINFIIASRQHSAQGVISLQGCTGSAGSDLGAQPARPANDTQ